MSASQTMKTPSFLSRLEADFSYMEESPGVVGDINSKAAAWLSKMKSELDAFRSEAKNLPNEAKAALSSIIDSMGQTVMTIEDHVFRIDGAKGKRPLLGISGK